MINTLKTSEEIESFKYTSEFIAVKTLSKLSLFDLENGNEVLSLSTKWRHLINYYELSEKFLVVCFIVYEEIRAEFEPELSKNSKVNKNPPISRHLLKFNVYELVSTPTGVETTLVYEISVPLPRDEYYNHTYTPSVCVAGNNYKTFVFTACDKIIKYVDGVHKNTFYVRKEEAEKSAFRELIPNEIFIGNDENILSLYGNILRLWNNTGSIKKIELKNIDLRLKKMMYTPSRRGVIIKLYEGCFELYDVSNGELNFVERIISTNSELRLNKEFDDRKVFIYPERYGTCLRINSLMNNSLIQNNCSLMN